MNEQEFDDFYAASFSRLTGQLYAMISAAELPLSVMCVFSEDGCPSGTPFTNRRRRP